MASVTPDSVTLNYASGTVGLRDVSLEVGDGEFIALVGPSGSGKTTLLRTIAGFLKPSEGAVEIDGRVVAGKSAFVAPEHRGLGMVFQQQAVWPHWSVGKNVEYPLRRAGISRAERRKRVERTLELVGLEGYAKRDPATLSGGQRQRVALARALVGEPRVLLLDEALSALDEPLRDRLRLELHSLTRQLGLTVVHVTHDRAEALALADRVVVLDRGAVQQTGTPEELVTNPESGFVARFLSDATLIDGVVDVDGFVAAEHPLRWGSFEGSRAAGDACAVILPSHVAVSPDKKGDATVRSSLFMPDGADLMLDWSGTPLRVRAHGVRPKVGERVQVTVTRPLVYQGHGDAARQSTELVAAALAERR